MDNLQFAYSTDGGMRVVTAPAIVIATAKPAFVTTEPDPAAGKGRIFWGNGGYAVCEGGWKFTGIRPAGKR